MADLHSALAAAPLAVAYDRPGTRVVYVMTDQGALPLAFSRSVAALRAAGLLAGSVTVGQSFGGDLEAVTVHSGLLAARLALAADLVIVVPRARATWAPAPAGASPGVAAGEAVNAAADARRPAGRGAAHLGRRPTGAAPRRVPSQPDRLRAGRPAPV